ncbi:MAG: hypothetical protein HY401_09540 [Elusimicrobia bacterium]|nr:hypothetical protein [Elusimicrobiota bacterium]
MPPDPRTSPDGSPHPWWVGPLSTNGFKGVSPALNPFDGRGNHQIYGKGLA